MSSFVQPSSWSVTLARPGAFTAVSEHDSAAKLNSFSSPPRPDLAVVRGAVCTRLCNVKDDSLVLWLRRINPLRKVSNTLFHPV